MQSGLGVPEHFQLRFAGRDVLTCRVVWRSDRQAGVSFEQPDAEPKAGEDLARSTDSPDARPDAGATRRA